MDPAIQMLYDEHRVIERIVGALGRLAALAIEGAQVPLAAAEETIDLMRRCVDDYHHGKEERILFPMLVEQRRYRLRVPVGVLNREHEIARGQVREMGKAAAEGLEGHWAEVFSGHAVVYQDLLRTHIVKEDRGLFPTAGRALSGEERQVLGRRFDEFEARAADHLDDYRRRVLELEMGLKRA